jgi:4-hydroxy-tetrahydrodipicolinate synthase
MRAMVEEPRRRREIEFGLSEIFDALAVTTNPIPVKAELNLLGHEVGSPRLPLVEAEESELAVISAALERHGLLTATHS